MIFVLFLEAKFREINTAYEVLGDENKRQIYDQKGKAGLEDQGNVTIKDLLTLLFGAGKFEECKKIFFFFLHF